MRRLSTAQSLLGRRIPVKELLRGRKGGRWLLVWFGGCWARIRSGEVGKDGLVGAAGCRRSVLWMVLGEDRGR